MCCFRKYSYPSCQGFLSLNPLPLGNIGLASYFIAFQTPLPWNFCQPSILELKNVALLFAVNIAPAAVRVPEAVTPQQAASGQTAILYPSAHSHALGQMVCVTSLLFNYFVNNCLVNNNKGLLSMQMNRCHKMKE